MAMKKIHAYIKSFFASHYKLSICLSSIIFLISCIAIVYSNLTFVVAACFGFSLVTVLRLITYKTGKIPFVMTDNTWNVYRLKYSKEEAEKRYEEMSLNRAAAYFIVTLVSFFIWAICEVLILLFRML